MFLQSPGTKSGQGSTQDVFAYDSGQEGHEELQLLQVTAEIFLRLPKLICRTCLRRIQRVLTTQLAVRFSLHMELMLKPKYLLKVFTQWEVPSIDLMATPFNCQVPLFFSCYCPQVLAQDALS